MKIICIEGIDAVGKETVSKTLEEVIRKKGYSVLRVSFPKYESNIGKVINDVLHGSCGDASTLDPSLMAPLYTIDRLQYFKANPNVFNYDYLILDRSFYSNFMYQASKLYDVYSEMYDDNKRIFQDMSKWIFDNYKLEFEDTGLSVCESINTFVLSLSEEDSLKQLSTRKEVDDNEKNRDYLDKCKEFVTFMMSDEITHFAHEIIDKMYQVSFQMKDFYRNAFEKYIFNVHPIEVIHAENESDIPEATMKIVDKIIAFFAELKDSDTSNKETDDDNDMMRFPIKIMGVDVLNSDELLIISSMMNFSEIAYKYFHRRIKMFDSAINSIYESYSDNVQIIHSTIVEQYEVSIYCSPLKIDVKTNLVFSPKDNVPSDFIKTDKFYKSLLKNFYKSLPEKYTHSSVNIKVIYDGTNFKIEKIEGDAKL